MLKKMTRDVATFLALLVIFLLSYAIAFEAIRRPFSSHGYDHMDDNVRIFLLPSFQMYGEVFLDDIESTVGCSGPRHFQSCQSTLQSIVLPFFIWSYCLLSNVIMVNLLIGTYYIVEIHNVLVVGLLLLDLILNLVVETSSMYQSASCMCVYFGRPFCSHDGSNL